MGLLTDYMLIVAFAMCILVLVSVMLSRMLISTGMRPIVAGCCRRRLSRRELQRFCLSVPGVR